MFIIEDDNDFYLPVEIPLELSSIVAEPSVELLFNELALAKWEERDREDCNSFPIVRGIIYIFLKDYKAYEVLEELSLLYSNPQEYIHDGIYDEYLDYDPKGFIAGLKDLETNLWYSLHREAVNRELRTLH